MSNQASFGAGPLLAAGADHHRAGRLAEAERHYRQVLALDPNQPDALHLLGVIALQSGRPEAAIDLFQRALKQRRKFPEALSNLGLAQKRLGSLDAAARSLEKAAELNPKDAAALNNLGIVERARGRLDAALRALKKALALAPTDAELHYNLGNVLADKKDQDGAMRAYAEALRLRPAYAEAATNLGNLHLARGDTDTATALWERAIAINPTYTTALVNLAGQMLGMGESVRAAELCRRALAQDAAQVQAEILLGEASEILGALDEAEAAYRRAAEIAPKDKAPLLGLAKIAKSESRLDGAREFYQRLRILNPDDSSVRVMEAALLPAIPKDEEEIEAARAAMDLALDGLIADGIRIGDPYREIGITNFYLAYHDRDDRPLQEKWAKFFLNACPELGWTAPHCRKPKVGRRPGKIRVGFLSAHLKYHTIGKLNRGLIALLDRTRFEVLVIRPAAKRDSMMDTIDKSADGTVTLPLDLKSAREKIAELELDILYYLDVGMDPFTYFLAFARLAPVQCVTWGHPDTTGIPNIDYFLSPTDCEPEGAEAHYSERLIRLDHLPSYYYRPEPLELTRDRAHFGLPEHGRLYFCAQTLFKFHPRFDPLLGEILQKDHQGHLVLIAPAQTHWLEILRNRFRRAFPDAAGRVHFVPRMPEGDFLCLQKLADALLDTPHFSGGNSSYEAFAFGSPIVTLPGRFMRSRPTAAQYKAMGLESMICQTPEAYVAMALEIATDPAQRRTMGDDIIGGAGKIFENQAHIDEYERIFNMLIDQPHPKA